MRAPRVSTSPAVSTATLRFGEHPHRATLRCARRVWACATSVLLAACGADSATDRDVPDAPAMGAPLPEHPAYVEHLAPLFERACARCHATTTATSEARNCVRIDRWDSAADLDGRCSDTTTGGRIFGVRDASARIVENIVSGRMPLGGPALADDEVQMVQRWRDAGFPKRAINQPPTIELRMPPTSGATVCETSCSYTIAYATDDPDGDSVTWSLAWAGAGQTGVFASGLAGGSGAVTIDATPLLAGTYTLTATLDDGTTEVSHAAAGSLTVTAGHNAAPTVTVMSPNGGEAYHDDQPITVAWTGADPDDTTLTYDIAAVGPTTIAIGSISAPPGPAQLVWTPPKATAPTGYRIQITAHDSVGRPAPVVDQSDADFVISPPPVVVSFATQIQPILTARCAGSDCHGASAAASLRLTAGAAYAALVGVAVRESPCQSYQRVVAGQPDTSYLMFKLQGAGACFGGSRMPRGEAALPAAQLQLIRDWIANGAPNN